jgi:cytochrome c oxidase cbb3-type subunit 3
MSDFISSFWNWYVILLVVASIVFCAVLLVTTGRAKVVPGASPLPKVAGPGGKEVEITGHVWDGDLAEYNNPLPKWWSYLFWITIFFGIGYLILYPGLGNLPGLLGWSSAGAYAKESAEADARVKPMFDKYLGMELTAVAADPQARAMGERIFLNNCAQCHGSNAAGGKGFPNLTDNDWLYGGAPETIRETVTNGRMGVMPALGPVIGEEATKNVANYVRSLSGLPNDGARAAQGQPIFMANCAACHGPEGKGNPAVGAPNLTDGVWLYGSSEATIIEGVNKGRNLSVTPGTTTMPSFKNTLDPGKIQLVAAYVWGLSNKPAK